MSVKRLIVTHDNKEFTVWLPERIVLTLPAYGEMFLAARLCPIEVSGYAEIKVSGNDYKVCDVVIPHQFCSGASTTSLDDNLYAAMQEIIERGKDPGDFYCWWHSHVEMSAHFSPIDIYAITDFQRYLLQGNQRKIVGPWISIVLNRMAEISARCDFAKPKFSLWDLPVVLEDGVGEEDIREYLFVHGSRVREILTLRVRYRGVTLEEKTNGN